MKLVAGVPGHRALNSDEPRPGGDLHSPPDWLNEPQKDIWREAVENAPPGMLKRLDESVFQTWVVAKSLHQEATTWVNKWGSVIRVGENNTPTQSPWLNVINKQAQIMMRAAAELGFSPSSRSRVRVQGSSTNTNRFAELKKLDDD
jgi:P27 family predicted phage terminase small subunit